MTGVNAIERDTNQNGQVSINGNRNQTNNYLLDGVEINETINNVIGLLRACQRGLGVAREIRHLAGVPFKLADDAVPPAE